MGRAARSQSADVFFSSQSKHTSNPNPKKTRNDEVRLEAIRASLRDRKGRRLRRGHRQVRPQRPVRPGARLRPGPSRQRQPHRRPRRVRQEGRALHLCVRRGPRRPRVANKDLRLKYTHEVKGKANHLQARFDVDDKTSATVGWNLHGFSAPDYRQFNLKLNYQHDDKWSFEPSYDFGSEAFAARVNHNLDDDNSLSLHYDAHANTGSVEWTNHSLGGPGALRVSATSSLSDNGLKQMPNISASKVFDLEL